MDTPSFTCSAPCTVKLPPWTGATRVVDYPLITVSSGTWTSTITRAPLTITDLMFNAVTIQAGGSFNGKQKRQGMEPFYPIPATTPAWPQVKYTGPDGKESQAGPSVPFPTPPASIGPNSKPPTSGRWPQKRVQPVSGTDTSPWVPRCSFNDFNCYQQPWQYGQAPFGGTEGDDNDGDNWDGMDIPDEELVTCPALPSTTTAATPTTSTLPTPKPSLRDGDPRLNSRHCYKSGYGAKHVRMDNAIASYCNQLYSKGSVLEAPFSYQFKFPFSGDPWPLVVVISLTVLEKCSWINRSPSLARSADEFGNSTSLETRGSQEGKELCSRYLHSIIDSCDCSSVDNKHGGTLENDCYEWRIDPNTDW